VAEGFVGQVRRDPDRRDRTSINAQTGFLTDDGIFTTPVDMPGLPQRLCFL